MSTWSRRIGALLVGGALPLVLATAAFAHTGIGPTVVAAGAESELTVFVGHGCFEEGAEDGAVGSSTVEISVQAPEGVQIVSAAERTDGWTAAVEGQVITWTGGVLPDGESGDFAFTAIADGADGDQLIFPIYQRCEVGEYQWAEPPAADGSEPERPAAVLTIGDPSTATEEAHGEVTATPEATAAAATAAPTETATAIAATELAGTEAPAATAAPTAAPAPAATPSAAAADATAVAATAAPATPVGGVATGAGGSAGSGPAVWLVAAASVALVVGAIVALRRRGPAA